MTEKRFRISQGYTDRFCHDWKKNKLLNFKQTIDCLNTFYEENEQLKSKNRGLQSELQIFKEDATHSNLQINKLADENEQLKASLYAEKTNTAEVVNDYSKQFKRHSAQFSFMMDLADDLGVDVATLEALDD